MAIKDKITNAIHRGSKRMENLGSKYVASIWELDGVPAFKQYWTYGIFPWKYVYKGYYQAWHELLEPTIAAAQHKRTMQRLNAAKFISAQLARYVWDEQCGISVTETGCDGDSKLQAFIDEVLRKNAFNVKLSGLFESAAALGGATIKCWCEVPKDENGNDIPDAEKKIKLSYHTADQFIPTAWDNAKIKGGIFISREARDGYYYTRLERHEWHGPKYVITNELYRIDERGREREAAIRGIEPQNILGWQYPLNELYPLLSPYTEVEGIEGSLFAYFGAAGANNLDDNSPLGMSVYGNAMDTLRAIDTAYDGFVQEIKLSRKRIIVPARAISKTVDENGKMRRYFDADNSVYEALNFDNTEDLKIQDTSSAMRVEQYVSAINNLLSILCVQTGLDAGALSFDKATGLKTATEVVSENSKTYATVRTHQHALKSAIERIIHGIIDVACGYDVQFEGTSVRQLVANGYEVNVHFDDSIIQDRQTDINEGILLMNNGLMSKLTFMVKNLGYTEEQAEAELSRIAEEAKVNVPDLGNISFGE